MRLVKSGKRLLSVLLLTVLFLLSFSFSAFAVKESAGSTLLVEDAENTGRYTISLPDAGPVLSSDHTQGKHSVSFTFSTDAIPENGLVIFQCIYEKPINVTGRNSFAFDFYIDHPELFDYVSRRGGGQFELTSSGRCDNEESSTNYTTFVGLNKGWNPIVFNVSDGPNDLQKERFNYIRFYIWFDKAKLPSFTTTIRFDNLHFCNYDFKTPFSSCQSLSDVVSTHEINLDTNGFTEGGSSYLWQVTPRTDPSMLLKVYPDEPVNVLGCNQLLFDLYISNLDYIRYWDIQTYVRLGFGDHPDQNYYEWNLAQDGFYILGLGWNHVLLLFQAAEVEGMPDLSACTQFTLEMKDLHTDLKDKTTFRLDGILTDAGSVSLDIGQDFAKEGLSSGLKYQDDDTDHFYDEPEEPVTDPDPEDETDPQETETEPESIETDRPETETNKPVNMLDEGEEENTYTTARAKVVARVASAVLILVSVGVTVLACWIHFKKNAL